MEVKSLSHVGASATPWTAAFQAPPSTGFSRREYWSGVPLPSLYAYLTCLHIVLVSGIPHSNSVIFSNYILEGNGSPVQYSCLENPVDRGAWKAAVHGVAESWTRLSDFTFTFHFHALEKEMATHSSVLAWRIPGTVEPDGLPSMGSHRVRHD